MVQVVCLFMILVLSLSDCVLGMCMLVVSLSNCVLGLCFSYAKKVIHHLLCR